MDVFFDEIEVQHERLVWQENAYYPYGLAIKPLEREGEPDHRFTYNGKELEEETDWHDYGARRYDAQIGRWGGVDPAVGLSFSQTPYQYVYNSPVNYIDPNGMWTVDKDGNVHSDNAAEAQDFIQALQDRAAYNDKKGTEGAGYEIYVDSYEGGEKGNEAFRMISKDGGGGLVQIFHQRTNKGTSHKHSKGEAWSVGGSFIFGAGAEFSVGKVSDGYGDSKWFWNINAGVGLDVGLGLSSSGVESILRERPFRVGDWAGAGAGLEASVDLKFFGASMAKTWNIDLKKASNSDWINPLHANDPKAVGATYITTDIGAGRGPSDNAFSPRIPTRLFNLRIPIDAKYVFGKTDFFDR